MDFSPHRHHNAFKTTLLFAVLWGLLIGIGILVQSGRFLWVFAAFGVLMTAWTYWNCDKIAIRAMRAYPVASAQQPAMHRVVHGLAAEMGMAMPSLFVSPTGAPNAFATGRSPSHAAVCCTEGILSLLDERELRGVLAHELMHVKNRDVLTSSIAAALAGVLTSVAHGLLWFGGGSRGNSRDAGPLAAIAMVAIVILAPLAATVIQLAISRTREYDADEDAARLTRDPLALASALAKLEGGIDRAPLAPEPRLHDVSHLMIANPFRQGGLTRMFSTHPPTEDRIARLRTMAGGALGTRRGRYR